MGLPPFAETTQMLLFATFQRPNHAGFPETNAIQLPSGDQVREWRAKLAATGVVWSLSRSRTSTESFRAKATDLLSGDQVADVGWGMISRPCPPRAGTSSMPRGVMASSRSP